MRNEEREGMEHEFDIAIPKGKLHEHARAAVVACMDDRFWPAVRDCMAKRGYGEHDIFMILVAGGAMKLALSEHSPHFIATREDISAAVERLGVNELHLFMHQNGCGGYLLYRDAAPENQAALQEADARTILARLKQHFPGLKELTMTILRGAKNQTSEEGDVISSFRLDREGVVAA
jgi:carbonic anhydrase